MARRRNVVYKKDPWTRESGNRKQAESEINNTKEAGKRPPGLGLVV